MDPGTIKIKFSDLFSVHISFRFPLGTIHYGNRVVEFSNKGYKIRMIFALDSTYSMEIIAVNPRNVLLSSKIFLSVYC